MQKDGFFVNSCAFFLLDARTFFWHFSAMTHVTEISVTTDPQQHAIYVTFGLKTRLEYLIIVISGSLPVKLPIKIYPEKNFIAPKDAP